jgi:hypothetical protein
LKGKELLAKMRVFALEFYEKRFDNFKREFKGGKLVHYDT